MPDDVPTVQLIEAVALADGKGRERIVAMLEGGDIAVATRPIGEARAEHELNFNLGEALKLSKLCLAGNSHALTAPGLTRVLCASVIALTRAAYLAGALDISEARNGDGRTDADPVQG
jgi:hypothetical protein